MCSVWRTTTLHGTQQCFFVNTLGMLFARKLSRGCNQGVHGPVRGVMRTEERIRQFHGRSLAVSSFNPLMRPDEVARHGLSESSPTSGDWGRLPGSAYPLTELPPRRARIVLEDEQPVLGLSASQHSALGLERHERLDIVSHDPR